MYSLVSMSSRYFPRMSTFWLRGTDKLLGKAAYLELLIDVFYNRVKCIFVIDCVSETGSIHHCQSQLNLKIIIFDGIKDIFS